VERERLHLGRVMSEHFRDYTRRGEIVSARCCRDQIRRMRIVYRFEARGVSHYFIQRETTATDGEGVALPESDLIFDGGKAADEYARTGKPIGRGL
jgi:hypothetical protein